MSSLVFEVLKRIGVQQCRLTWSCLRFWVGHQWAILPLPLLPSWRRLIILHDLWGKHRLVEFPEEPERGCDYDMVEISYDSLEVDYSSVVTWAGDGLDFAPQEKAVRSHHIKRAYTRESIQDGWPLLAKHVAPRFWFLVLLLPWERKLWGRQSPSMLGCNWRWIVEPPPVRKKRKVVEA